MREMSFAACVGWIDVIRRHMRRCFALDTGYRSQIAEFPYTKHRGDAAIISNVDHHSSTSGAGSYYQYASAKITEKRRENGHGRECVDD